MKKKSDEKPPNKQVKFQVSKRVAVKQEGATDGTERMQTTLNGKCAEGTLDRLRLQMPVGTQRLS